MNHTCVAVCQQQARLSMKWMLKRKEEEEAEAVAKKP